MDVCTNMNTDAHPKAYTDMHGDVHVDAIGERKKMTTRWTKEEGRR